MERDEESQRAEKHKPLKGGTKRLAGLDPHTGLLNRYGWLATAARMLNRASRGHQHLGLLLAEFDQFTQLREEFSSEVAENVLQQVVEVLDGHVRPSDLLGRWGDNQVIFLLPAIEADALRKVADRMQQAVRALAFKAKDRSLPATVSLGGAAWMPRTGHPKELEALISEAETKLEQAKRHGRNQAVL